MITAVILSLLSVALAVGPLGHLNLYTYFVPDIILLCLWAMTWFFGYKQSLTYALVTAILLELTLNFPSTFWIVVVMSVWAMLMLSKKRFFEVGNIFHAVAAFVCASIIKYIYILIYLRLFDYKSQLSELAGSVIIVMVLFYLISYRYKFGLKWTGQRISDETF